MLPGSMQQLSNPLGLGMAQPTIEIIKCIFVATGSYQTLVHRPYNGTLDQQNLNLFMQQTNGGRDVNIATLAGISNHFLMPTTAPQGNVQIANGFNNQRVRFYMLIRLVRPGSIPQFQAITGWTDVMGLDFNTKSISPDMRLHFNSVMSICQLGDGSFAMDDNSQIIYNMPSYAPALGGFEAARIHTLMPEDVMNFIGYNHLGGGGFGAGQDARGQAATTPLVKSSRSNNLTTKYLDRTINEFGASLHAQDLSQANMLEVTAHARANLKENRVNSDLFLELIRRNSDYDAQGSLTFSNLCHILPNLNAVIDVVDNRKDVSQLVTTNFGQVSAGNFCDWSNQRPETIFATRLIQTIPSIMMELSISRAHFKLTNLTNDGSECSMAFDGVESLIPNYDLNAPLRRLQQRLVTEVLRDISLGNAVKYSIVTNVNVFGDTYIKLSLNGQPAIDYCMPSFCDSTAVPTVATNTMAIGSVAHVVSILTNPEGPL